jgi:hypothetical protein
MVQCNNIVITTLGLERHRITALPSGGGPITVTLDVDPFEFLVQAEDDYAAGGTSASLNAITNAKRAIVAQMDQTLKSFGYESTRFNIPRKIEALRELGVVFPRILQRVSDARNLLEHEYVRPTDQQVTEALDLASLFVAAAKPATENFGGEFGIGNEDEQMSDFICAHHLSLNFDPEDRQFQVCATDYSSTPAVSVGRTTIDKRDPSFGPIVRLAIASDTNFRLKESLGAFSDAVGLKT